MIFPISRLSLSAHPEAAAFEIVVTVFQRKPEAVNGLMETDSVVVSVKMSLRAGYQNLIYKKGSKKKEMQKE